LIVNAVHSITIGKGEDEQVITDRNHINEFLNNCEAEIGNAIETSVTEINKIGIQKTMQFECEKCEKEFEAGVTFDPVNFFTAS